jgi:ABC-type multidrug transport system ATPase subunit
MSESSLSRSNRADVEKTACGDYAHLSNTTANSFAWENVSVTVKDRQTKQPKTIVNNINGIVKAGELLALMGPSGCGKTTLLNVLAHRVSTQSAEITQNLYLNGTKTSLKTFQNISVYVEQDDALLGSLTVRETLYFAAKLSLPR